MPGKVLLDTSILVELLRGDPSLESRLQESEEVFTSVIALGELLYGARRAALKEENRRRVDQLAQALSVLPCDRMTSEVYARLKDGLRQRGRPIPDNDLWIAATAVQHGLQLVGRDSHFAAIDELQHLDW